MIIHTNIIHSVINIQIAIIRVPQSNIVRINAVSKYERVIPISVINCVICITGIIKIIIAFIRASNVCVIISQKVNNSLNIYALNRTCKAVV